MSTPARVPSSVSACPHRGSIPSPAAVAQSRSPWANWPVTKPSTPLHPTTEHVAHTTATMSSNRFERHGEPAESTWPMARLPAPPPALAPATGSLPASMPGSAACSAVHARAVWTRPTRNRTGGRESAPHHATSWMPSGMMRRALAPGSRRRALQADTGVMTHALPLRSQAIAGPQFHSLHWGDSDRRPREQQQPHPHCH